MVQAESVLTANVLFEVEIFKVSNVTKWLIFQNLVAYQQGSMIYRKLQIFSLLARIIWSKYSLIVRSFDQSFSVKVMFH